MKTREPRYPWTETRHYNIMMSGKSRGMRKEIDLPGKEERGKRL